MHWYGHTRDSSYQQPNTDTEQTLTSNIIYRSDVMVSVVIRGSWETYKA